ncbi:hypothetical protein BS78_09G177600 [Paspalum vaginatum]|nr:hypothetical protein BS78_09G177600 [Paspalum vaginatum]
MACYTPHVCCTSSTQHSARGTPAYVAPQVLSREGYSGCRKDRSQMSGSFDEKFGQREARLYFQASSQQQLSFAKRNELAKYWKLKVSTQITEKMMGGFKLATTKERRTQEKDILELDADVLKTAPFLSVELKKTNGNCDTLENQELMKDGIRPSLLNKL